MSDHLVIFFTNNSISFTKADWQMLVFFPDVIAVECACVLRTDVLCLSAGCGERVFPLGPVPGAGKKRRTGGNDSGRASEIRQG